MAQPLGLIAGDGEFPVEIARAARQAGRRVHAVAFLHLTSPQLDAEVDDVDWLHPGEIEGLLGAFRRTGVRDVMMAGKVGKTRLFAPDAERRIDRLAGDLLAALPDRSDASILAAFVDLLCSQGFAVRPQNELVPGLAAEEGQIGQVAAQGSALRDVEYGWPIARRLAAEDIGQCVVVKSKAVLAVEAIEGTDEVVRRAGRLCGPGACVIKVARPDQDPRFDLPVVGPDTLAALVEVRAAVLAVEAGSTLVLGRRALIDRANANGIAVIGVGRSGRVAGMEG